MTTANKVPEKWAKYHKSMLLSAIGDIPLITISFEPLDFGKNLIQTEYSLVNVYRQILRGAKEAQTEYVAIAEDDTLYPREHFEFRSKKISYDLNRWTIYTWLDPIYMHKPHIANCGMVAPRKILIKALQARFDKYGNDMPKWLLKEVGRYDHQYKLPDIEIETFYSDIPFLCFSHLNSIDQAEQNKNKKIWPVQAYDIPMWGRADKIIKRFI